MAEEAFLKVLYVGGLVTGGMEGEEEERVVAANNPPLMDGFGSWMDDAKVEGSP